MIIGIDWKFRDDIKEDTVPIELLTDPYKDVILRYTRVSIHEQEDGTAKLKFDYEIHSAGSHTMAELRNDEKFNVHIGLILNTMILDIADMESRQNEPGTDDFEEPIEERGLHS
jgi:hypothetical protein